VKRTQSAQGLGHSEPFLIPEGDQTMATKKKAQSKPKPKVTRKPSSVIVLFGIDAEGIPRGARFPDDDQNHLATVALAQGLRLAIATKPAHFQAIETLTIGRAGKPGKTNIPKISAESLAILNDLVGGDIGSISSTFAKSPDELAPGHMVLAASDSVLDGYFPALIVQREAERLLLRWRDEPSLEPFQRKVSEIGLVNPINSA
jgi:hypothetical protein